MHQFPVPAGIPGRRVNDRQHAEHLKEKLAQLCDVPGRRFPGSQPVSFSYHSLELLEKQDFWVCEKSDGVRVMVMVLFNNQDNRQEVFLVDRKEEFYQIDGLPFPHHDDIMIQRTDTVLDGELVIDVDPRTQENQLSFLAFDCVVLDGESLMKKSLTSRYGRLREFIHRPQRKLFEKFPHLQQQMPFEFKIKTMELAYGITKVLQDDVPKLTHGNDGLIFTCAESGYTPGTDERILKWKPPSENSIDFRLELRFPALDQQHPGDADFLAKPMFILMMNCGRGGEEFFDSLDISDEEWHNWKVQREQLDNRIVEVVWDATAQTWRILRFRDDKREGNYRDVVFKIIQSIQDGVEADQLMLAAPRIRTAWKERELAKRGVAAPGGPQPQPQASLYGGPPRDNTYGAPPPQQPPPRPSGVAAGLNLE